MITSSVRVFGTLTDGTGSRAINGTVYHNTSGRPLKVSVSAATTAANGVIVAYSDAAAGPTTVVHAARAAAVSDLINVSFVVCPGHYYSVNNTTCALNNWAEWV